MTRILVGIANHGTKNREFLDRLLDAYRRMSHEVDVVVCSDAPKDLGPDVEVRVGAPSPNPRSLPFAPRWLFAERADDYDLFIYSEDDTLIEQRHVDAFLDVTAQLPDDAIAGFMRYEVDPAGERSFCSVHTGYHWDPRSIRRHGGLVFAEFTNPHAASYMLTRDQLRLVIASGGFLVPPHEGRFPMLESAATDPYTRCGLRRLVCVSRIDDFLLHHLPNVYLGRFGVDRQAFDAQIAAIERCAGAGTTPGSLFPGVAELTDERWNKRYFDPPEPRVLEAVPADAGSVLSVGCTSGALEADVAAHGARVVAVPVDDIVGAAAAARGIEVLPADLDTAVARLEGRLFDTLLLADVLAHVPDPVGFVRGLRPLVAPGGRVVVTAPNFRHHRLRHRLGRGPDVRAGAGYARRRLHLTDPRRVRRWLVAAGLEVCDERVWAEGRIEQARAMARGLADPWLGVTSVTVGRRQAKSRTAVTRL